MNIKKAITSLLGIAVLAMVGVGAASAQTPTSFSGVLNGYGNVFSYSGATGFGTTPGATFTAQDAFTTNPLSTLTFTGLANDGVLTTNNMGQYTQALTGGTFLLASSGGSTLLSGTFGGGNLLVGTLGSDAGTVRNTLVNVVYTGGSYFTASGLINPGSFAFSMTGINPVLSVTNGRFDDFTASGSGTFSASRPSSVVPEPATVVPFVLGGLGLLGLAVRKSRRTSGAAV